MFVGDGRDLIKNPRRGWNFAGGFHGDFKMQTDFTSSAARLCRWIQKLNDEQLDELQAILDDAPPLDDAGPLFCEAMGMVG